MVDGLRDVGLADLDAAVEVGDGAGDFQDAVVCSRAHVHAGDGLAEFFHSFGVGFGVLVQQRGGHLGVVVHAGVVLEAQALDGSRLNNALPYRRAWLTWCFARHLVEVDGLNLYLQVDSVQQWARNLAHIVVTLVGRADALLGGVAVVAARARIHRCHEHERGGVVDAVLGTADADVAVLQRLPHHLKHRAVKFRQLVKKKSTPLCASEISPGVG